MPRMDRIERALELLIDDHIQFREEHKRLLTALAEAQKHTDERFNALITVVDGIIRNRPLQ